ncbi:MAG: FAD-binding protein, partial [Planctomycetia bacterium]|nr:FAD-binding protein [Planctomycetia bacterium]
AEAKNITVLEDTFALDLLTADERVVGVLAWQGGPVAVFARRTILATGGLGQIFRETTNPDVATGDGLAMAYRAGADLADMEFIQFHPTTLYLAGASRQLISETVRGEGAYLIDKNGRRFMFDYHTDGELAPRDVVSQAIVRQMALTRSTQVFLDLRHLDAKHVRVRFPNIWQTCAEFDIDISEDLIPVRPSAHYMIGGIAVDDEGRTTLENLLACGEVASTGLHGANRLGSNSLLEALVYGRVTGRVVAEEISAERRPAETPPITSQIDESMRANLNIRDVRNSLKAAMWRNVGIERRGTQLAETDKSMEFWQSYVLDKVFADSEGWELQNMLSLGRLMAHAALLREETRGVHHRVDFPERDDANWSRHTIIRRGQPAKSV